MTAICHTYPNDTHYADRSKPFTADVIFTVYVKGGPVVPGDPEDFYEGDTHSFTAVVVDHRTGIHLDVTGLARYRHNAEYVVRQAMMDVGMLNFRVKDQHGFPMVLNDNYLHVFERYNNYPIDWYFE